MGAAEKQTRDIDTGHGKQHSKLEQKWKDRTSAQRRVRVWCPKAWLTYRGTKPVTHRQQFYQKGCTSTIHNSRRPTAGDHWYRYARPDCQISTALYTELLRTSSPIRRPQRHPQTRCFRPDNGRRRITRGNRLLFTGAERCVSLDSLVSRDGRQPNGDQTKMKIHEKATPFYCS